MAQVLTAISTREMNSVKTYSASKDDSGRVPFANAFKALYSNNGSAFPYWLDQVMGRGIEDLYAHVAAQYRLVWAYSVLLHYKMCREFNVQVQRGIMAEVESALTAIALLLSYDKLAPIKRTVVDTRFQTPSNPLESVSYEINAFRTNGYSGCDEEYVQEQWRNVAAALLNGRHEALLWWTFPRLLCEPGMDQEVELPLGSLASWLVTLSAMVNRDEPVLAKKFEEVARVCAWRVSPSTVDYPTMLDSFRNAKVAVPPPAPQPRSSECWRVSLEGELSADSLGGDNLSVAGTVGPTTERDVLRGVEKSLLGLVGMDDFKQLLAMDVFEFLSSQQSRGRVYWGASGVGKTEVAQRLCGSREGFPKLSIGPGEVRYVSGVDGKLEIKEIVDGLPPLSLLFIDEADKCLDPKAGMVSAAEATQIRHAIITHFQRKPVMWIFLGVYAQMRSAGALTDDSLRMTFGDELAHRLDYADWGFPAWTLENLLRAVNGATSRRKLQYEDEAALILAQYCIKSGGGVRAFDNLETAIIRRLRTGGQALDARVSPSIAREILAKRGVQTAG